MKFFNIDYHFAVIEDVRTMLGHQGHSVTIKDLSQHPWLRGKSKAHVPGLEDIDWYGFGQKEVDRFWSRRPNLDPYDGFIVTHSPCLIGLYERTEKPVVCVVSTRFDLFCRDTREWLYLTIRRMHVSGQLTVVANNIYDRLHFYDHTGVLPTLIPSVCDYTGMKWVGGLPPVYHGKYDVDLGLRKLLPGHSWGEVAKADAHVIVPYTASQMAVFERHTMGCPMIMPSALWLRRHPESASELSHYGEVTGFDIDRMARWSDWYTDELPGITFFDDVTEIPDLLKSVKPTTGQMGRKVKILKAWETLLSKL